VTYSRRYYEDVLYWAYADMLFAVLGFVLCIFVARIFQVSFPRVVHALVVSYMLSFPLSLYILHSNEYNSVVYSTTVRPASFLVSMCATMLFRALVRTKRL
jgi:hypothetical protein